MKRNRRSPEKGSSHHRLMRQEKTWRKRFGLSTIFGPPLDTGQSLLAISSPSFSRSLPLRGRTREQGARSLEWVDAGGSCSRGTSLLRFENLGGMHGLEKVDPG